ncbi:MAG: AMP-binding protein [Actinomycetota bacterium]|nr:AMP-binding protein [Actinomycetota bacterium]
MADPNPEIDVPEVPLTAFVLAEAEKRSGRAALVDAGSGRTVSYGELASAVGRAAEGLHARGVRKGDVFAIWCPNSPEFVTAYYAALSIGAVVTPVNPVATAGDLAKQLAITSARWLLTTPELFAKAGGADSPSTGGLREVFVVGEAAGATPFVSLLGESGAAPCVDVGPDDVALLPFSSGTTGLPKAVVLTHRNLVTSLCQTAAIHRVGGNDVLIAAVPLFHIYGMQVVMNLGLRAGATVVLMARFDLDGFLLAVQDHRVTRADVVPPVVVALAKHAAVDAYALSSLRVITSAAAPLGADVARRCSQRLACRVKQAYGMTELGGGTHFAPDEGEERLGSVGPALPGVECRVVDCSTGEPAAPGEPGELLVRCAGTMRGYLGRPAETAAAINDDGWLRTGDVVIVDGDGWLQVVDRVKELVKYNGYQVPPAELEAVLLSHPAVADAAVVASPDEHAGEVPKAFVVPRSAVSEDELLAHVAERVAPYKKVRRLEFVDHIPKSASGKILRRLLVERERAMAASGLVAAGR